MIDNYTISTIASTVVGAVFTGGLTYLLTIKSQKAKIKAEVKSAELDNNTKVIQSWIDLAEGVKKELRDQREYTTMLKSELDEQRAKSRELAKQLERLRCEITRLKKINNEMVEMMGKVSAETKEQIEVLVAKYKQETENIEQ